MNLCLVCRDVCSDPASGLVRATGELAKALADEGHDVHLVTDISAPPAPELPGVTIKRVLVPPLDEPPRAAGPETALHNLMHAAAVYREVKRIHEHEQRVDAVLAPLWRSLGAVCLLDDRFPTIVSCMTSLRTLTEIDKAYHVLPDLEERLALEREALCRSRYLHGLTEAALAKTIRDYDLVPAQAEVVSRGLRDRLGPHPVAAAETTRVLFVGRIERRKGVDVLLAAARQLVEDGVDVSLTLAGPQADPVLLEPFAAQAASLPRLREAVRFAGVVSDAELDRLYAESDIVCLPSRYESHGIALVEAMMFGKAIVTCDAGGIGEVVDPERTAMVVPPDDSAGLAACLRRLVADPQLRKRLGSAARETYEARFEAAAVADQMQTFIERAIAVHRGRAPEAEGIERGLEDLVADVLRLNRGSAAALAAELLDPMRYGPLQRLRTAALSTPSPVRVSARNDPLVTAVVLTHDRPELLNRALDSLRESHTPLEVLVIDNGSRPGAARSVAANCALRPNVRLQRSERNLGCAHGRQLGVELTRSELILFLDDDAELMPGAVDHLLAELEAHREAAAVTATVLGAHGRVLHSGGSVEVSDGIAMFALTGEGSALTDAAVRHSGPTDWVPGTAVLMHRDLLLDHPIDARMAAYYEDNEWSYRVALERPGSFRRCREALAVHHLAPTEFGPRALDQRRRSVELLAAHARFYERHRLLLGPWLFHVVPGLCAEDGSYDLAGARLLLELVTAKSAEWTLAAWMNGDLNTLIEGRRRRVNLEREASRLRQAVRAQEEAVAFLHRRNETLCRIEQGGWWQLRGHILPLLRLLGTARAGVRNARSWVALLLRDA